jgi:hypothetical protein
VHTSLGHKFQGSRAPSCVHYGFMVGGSSLENIAKDCWVFLPSCEGFSQDISCVLVHGFSSSDLGYCINCEWCSCICLWFKYMIKMK